MEFLVVLSGLPGAGKSLLADGLARRMRLPVLSVDLIDAALARSGLPSPGVAAYEVAAALATEQLSRGLSCIIDAVNPVEAARAPWRALAAGLGVSLAVIECVCSDRALHRRRLEGRHRGIEGLPEVGWSDVEARRAEYQPWSDSRLVLDSAKNTPEEMVGAAMNYLTAERG